MAALCRRFGDLQHQTSPAIQSFKRPSKLLFTNSEGAAMVVHTHGKENQSSAPGAAESYGTSTKA